VAEEMITLGAALAELENAPPPAPVQPDTERALLGGLLLDGWRARDVLDEVGLRAEDFAIRAHGVTFAAITKLADAGRPVDPVTVTDELARAGTLEVAGGRTAVAKLQTLVPGSAHVAFYARQVRELAARRRIMEALQAALVQAAAYAPIEELRTAVTACFDAAVDDHAQGPRHISEIVPEALDKLERKPEGLIPTGLADLDYQLDGGFEGSRLYFFAGRPGAGKTGVAHRITIAGARAGGAALFSLEMSGAQNVARVLVSEARVNRRVLREGKAQSQQAWNKVSDVIGDVGELPIYIDDRGAASLAQVRHESRKLVRRHGVRLIVVDYLQLMEAEARRGYNKNDEVGALSKGLKALARELDVPVVCLSQLNRKCEERATKRPQVSDLRDSGSIEQDADVIVLLWRPQMYGSDIKVPFDAEGKVELHVAKWRDGETGSVWCRWDGKATRIDNLPQEEWPRRGGGA